MGVKGRMWSIIKKMYESSRRTVLLEVEKSSVFNVEQGACGPGLLFIPNTIFIIL